MKGKLIKSEDLKRFDGEIVYVEFNINPHEMTCCGDVEEHIKKCERMKKEHQDGLFKLKIEGEKMLLGHGISNRIVDGSLTRVDSEGDCYDVHYNLIGNIYEWIETKEKEQILVWGNPREDFHRLGIKAKRKWKGKGLDKGEIIAVYEVTEDDFRILCTEKYAEDTWIDCRWRWCEGSTLDAPTDKLVVNKTTITGWRIRPSKKKYKNLLKYFCEELGAVRYTDVYALAIDLARHNKMTLAQLFNKYQSK